MRWRKGLRLLIWTGVLGSAAFAGLAWWAGAEIASPTRRPLQDYHREFLADPAAHGVTLKTFTASDGTPCLICEPLANGQLGHRGVKVRAQLQDKLSLVAPGHVVGTLVLVHGRKGRKEDYLLIAERLCAVGFRCILPDMPAHGEHPTAIATYGILEGDLPALVLDEAAAKFGFEKKAVGLMGMSMGGSVAMHAAGKPNAPWQALVIVSSFDAFEPVVQFQASQRVGSWLGGPLSIGADNVYAMKTMGTLNKILPSLSAAHLKIPTLIAHGTEDTVVPIEAGRRLFAALPATLEKRWVEIPGAGHDNVLITDFPIYATIAEWFVSHLIAEPKAM